MEWLGLAVLLVCPISMGLMMLVMGRGRGTSDADAASGGPKGGADA